MKRGLWMVHNAKLEGIRKTGKRSKDEEKGNSREGKNGRLGKSENSAGVVQRKKLFSRIEDKEKIPNYLQ